MRVITTRYMIRKLPARYAEQYKSYRDDQLNKGKITSAIASLDLERCTPEDVERATGLKGWVDIKCDECMNKVPCAVILGGTDHNDCDSRIVYVCLSCTEKVMALFTESALSELEEEGKRLASVNPTRYRNKEERELEKLEMEH